MPLLPEQFAALDSLLLGLAPGENPVPVIRAEMPGLYVSRCTADDMRDETPFRSVGNFHIYLLGSADGHCWHLTKDAESASGVVVAARS